MFDLDQFREILSTISKNKLRTFLTSLAVAWGIFMLIVLLGVGNGFRDAVNLNFSDRAKNTITIWPGRTSLPYNGLSTGRNIRFDQKDYDLIKTKIPEIKYASALISRNVVVSYDKEYGSWDLQGVSEDGGYINNININGNNGRFINKVDVDDNRKVIVISDEIKRILFKDENPLGRYVVANGIAYLVIGVYSSDNQFSSSLPAYIPFTTAQKLYNQGYGFDQISFIVEGLNTIEENEAFIQKLRKQFGTIHSFAPEDRSALRVLNTAEQSVQSENISSIINIFITIIGIASLMAGIVGVGNIMLITVKERTKEIGIRKAIGATPLSVLKMIIFESVFITAAAGYIGMILGVAATELGSYIVSMMPSSGEQNILVFKDFTVDLNSIIWATIILIISGVFAGLIPAIRATRISPIEAMRSE